MTALTRWNPFKEMEDLQNGLSSILSNFGTWTPLSRLANGEEGLKVPDWTPLVDIVENGDGYLVKLDLPEVRKEDLKVTVENGALTISGERHFEKEEKGIKYHRVERAYGSFARSFMLPEHADPSKVHAEFKDGVLKIHVTKHANAQPKAIEVKVA